MGGWWILRGFTHRPEVVREYQINEVGAKRDPRLSREKGAMTCSRSDLFFLPPSPSVKPILRCYFITPFSFSSTLLSYLGTLGAEYFIQKFRSAVGGRDS